MINFHVCHSGHDCDNNKAKANLRNVGDKILFAANQFSQSVSDTIAVRVVSV